MYIFDENKNPEPITMCMYARTNNVYGYTYRVCTCSLHVENSFVMGISEFICTTLEMVMFVYYENDFLKAAKSPIPGKIVQRR